MTLARGCHVPAVGRATHRRHGRRMRGPELEALYREHDTLVRRVEWKHRLPTEDAEDLAQKAFMLAIEKKIGSEGNAAAWLIRTVDFLAVRHVSKLVRRARLRAHWVGGAIPTEEPEESEG